MGESVRSFEVEWGGVLEKGVVAKGGGDGGLVDQVSRDVRRLEGEGRKDKERQEDYKAVEAPMEKLCEELTALLAELEPGRGKDGKTKEGGMKDGGIKGGMKDGEMDIERLHRLKERYRQLQGLKKVEEVERLGEKWRGGEGGEVEEGVKKSLSACTLLFRQLDDNIAAVSLFCSMIGSIITIIII